jgi:hypothetical protein
MAEVWIVKLTGADRREAEELLARCQEAGAATRMTEALRLAIRLAKTIPIDQLPKTGAGRP